MKSLRHRFLLLALTCGALTTPAAGQRTASDVVAQLRATYEASEAFTARFVQTLDADFSDSASTLEGTITLSRKRYRIETAGQIVVTDGVTTWVYLIEDRQVIVNDYIDDDGTFSPNHFLDDRLDEYEIEFAQDPTSNDFVVDLRPKTSDSYIEEARLWIDRSNYTVNRIDVVDVNGASIRFRMTELTMGVEVDDDLFHFDPPEGVEVIDLRS